ncbi:MAG: hypothetical protein ACJA06_001170 [Halocynthiibacter sp.]|jgi:hypothetical protein
MKDWINGQIRAFWQLRVEGWHFDVSLRIGPLLDSRHEHRKQI